MNAQQIELEIEPLEISSNINAKEEFNDAKEELNISKEEKETHILIDASGTIIKVPIDIIEKIKTMKVWYEFERQPGESYYINKDPKEVHELLDKLYNRKQYTLDEYFTFNSNIRKNCYDEVEIYKVPNTNICYKILHNELILYLRYESYSNSRFMSKKISLYCPNTHNEIVINKEKYIVQRLEIRNYNSDHTYSQIIININNLSKIITNASIKHKISVKQYLINCGILYDPKQNQGKQFEYFITLLTELFFQYGSMLCFELNFSAKDFSYVLRCLNDIK